MRFFKIRTGGIVYDGVIPPHAETNFGGDSMTKLMVVIKDGKLEATATAYLEATVGKSSLQLGKYTLRLLPFLPEATPVGTPFSPDQFAALNRLAENQNLRQVVEGMWYSCDGDWETFQSDLDSIAHLAALAQVLGAELLIVEVK